MADSLVLTSAEVSALGGLIDSAPANRALDLLKVPDEMRTDPVRQAGLASLLVRDLARFDGETILLAPGPEMIFACIAGLRTCLQVGVVTAEHGDGFLILDSPAARVVIAPRAHGSYSALGLDPAADLAALLSEIIAASLPEDAEAVAAVVVADPELDPLRSLVVGVSHGRWTVAATGSEVPQGHHSRDEAMALLIDRSRVLVAPTDELRGADRGSAGHP